MMGCGHGAVQVIVRAVRLVTVTVGAPGGPGGPNRDDYKPIDNLVSKVCDGLTVHNY